MAEHGNNGAFRLDCNGSPLHVIVSDDKGWDHVSVTANGRCPTWEEMCYVKGLFFRPDECVMQLHPPDVIYENQNPHCLHLWRPHDETIPMPRRLMV